MKKIFSLGIIFLLLSSTFLTFIPIAQTDGSAAGISIDSFWTEPSTILVGENFTYMVKVRNIDTKPIYSYSLSYESFNPPESVSIVEDIRPYILVLPMKLNPGEATIIGPHALFNAKEPIEVKITVRVFWSYSEEGPYNNATNTFSFSISAAQTETYTIDFFTEPPNVGSITFDSTTYYDGQSATYASATYSISATPPSRLYFSQLVGY